MKQYQLDNGTLKLMVKRGPLFIRTVLFLFAFLSFIAPLTGMCLYISSGKGFHIGFLFGLVSFGLIGFYLLRIALWNTYGSELIKTSDDSLEYIADYGWFKGNSVHAKIDCPVSYSINQAGYEDENKGVLVLFYEGNEITCATKMDAEELEELIKKLKREF